MRIFLAAVVIATATYGAEGSSFAVIGSEGPVETPSVLFLKDDVAPQTAVSIVHLGDAAPATTAAIGVEERSADGAREKGKNDKIARTNFHAPTVIRAGIEGASFSVAVPAGATAPSAERGNERRQTEPVETAKMPAAPEVREE